MASLKLTDVCKSFGGTEVLHDINLEIRDGEFVVFVGPSGCGKSTLLRTIAGLEDITTGTLEFDGRTVNAHSPSERGIAMVFQSYALYPHMTVYQNMAFGLKLARGQPKEEIDRRVREAAAILQLDALLERLPRQLSGGQRQRVAIGRAIVRDPSVFLFDEPLSNLDAALRVQTRVEIARLHERMAGTTMIYVTHDQVEAMTLADRIVVLRDGYVEQVGPPMELYHRPANVFVARFLGSPSMNILPATAESGPDLVEVRIRGGAAPARLRPARSRPESGQVQVGVRPEDLELAQPSDALFAGRVAHVESLGEMQLAHVELPDLDELLIAKLDPRAAVSRGADISLAPRPDSLKLFESGGSSIAVAAAS